MKTEKNILIAFLLNFLFSIFEFVGGALTGSVAILSDAVHDIGDAISIGCSYVLERKSKKQPDEVYTYGYIRFSIIGSFITTVILLLGSIFVIYSAVGRIFHPVKIHYNGMILFAIIGTIVNFFAAMFTKGGHSLNQKAVNLHMVEDVLGWLLVLVGAVIMRFTELSVIDPLLSIAVSAFILIHAVKNIKQIENLFLERIPKGVNMGTLKEDISQIDGVLDVHHIHVWSIDGHHHYATMHIVTEEESGKMKETIRRELLKRNIVHVTLEMETPDEHCHYECCRMEHDEGIGHHHHRH